MRQSGKPKQDHTVSVILNTMLMPLFVVGVGLALLLVMGNTLACAANEIVWERTLNEYLGNRWEGELVHFPSEGDVRVEPTEHRLMLADENGIKREIAFQIVNPGQNETTKKWQFDLYCIIDLPAFGKRTLQLERMPPQLNLSQPMPLERNGNVLRIDNGAIKVEIPAACSTGQAEEKIPVPVLQVKNNNANRWIGGGHFKNVGALKDFVLQIETWVRSLPTSTSIIYSKKASYSIRLKLISEQPVVLLKEDFDFQSRHSLLVWDCSNGIELSTGLWQYYQTEYDYRRTNMGISKSYPLQLINKTEVTAFSPWIPWWESDITTWMELWDKEKKWAVGVFTGDPLEWSPWYEKAHTDSAFHLKITKDRQALLELPLKQGKRTWGISLAERTSDNDIGVNMKVDPYRHGRRQIKYAETPLDEVKDFTIHYKGVPPASYPQFLFSAAEQRRAPFALKKDHPLLKDVKEAMALVSDIPPLLAMRKGSGTGGCLRMKTLAQVAKNRDTAQGGNCWNQGTHTKATFVVSSCERSLEAVRFILWHGTGPGMSVAPHHWMTDGPLRYLSALADVGIPMLTPTEREVLRARMLFLAYKLSSERFWSPRLGLEANPNMTTMIYAHLAFISLVYPRHPMAEKWRKMALDRNSSPTGRVDGPQWRLARSPPLCDGFPGSYRGNRARYE